MYSTLSRCASFSSLCHHRRRRRRVCVRRRIFIILCVAYVARIWDLLLLRRASTINLSAISRFRWIDGTRRRRDFAVQCKPRFFRTHLFIQNEFAMPAKKLPTT